MTATPAVAVDSFFDVFTELPITGPPYPTASGIVLMGTDLGGTFQPTQAIETGTVDLKLNGLPPGEPVIGTLTLAGGGSGGQPPSIDSFFDVFIDVELPAPSSGRRISDIRIVHPPGTPPGTWRLVPINPGPPGSIDSFFDVFVDASFFDITYRVADDTGEHTHHMHGTSPSGRMSFFDVFVELRNPAPYPDGTVDSFFDVFVDFQMTGPPTTQPDIRHHMTGTYEGGVTPVSGRTWGAIKSLYR
jgi:hypothetical protein